jgi:hypothetical protein
METTYKGLASKLLAALVLSMCVLFFVVGFFQVIQWVL